MEIKTAFKSQDGRVKVLKAYDEIIERWPLPNEEIYIDTRYGKTFIIASGRKEAPPLILLHGSAMNSVMWMGDVPEYAKSYRVYAVDIPGEPGRSEGKQLPFEGVDFAEWLNDVYIALAIDKASLVGISLGAWLAAKFSIYYPDKVEKLVLLCPAGIGKQRISFLFKAVFHSALGEKGMDSLIRKVNGSQPIPDEMLEYQKLIGDNFNYRREVIPLFSDIELKRLIMPVILFVGKKDIMFHSGMTAKRLGSIVPHANINLLPEAGHVLINLTSEIKEFLASTNSPEH